MSGKSKLMLGKIKWVPRDTYVKRRKKRKLAKLSRRKNRSKK